MATPYFPGPGPGIVEYIDGTAITVSATIFEGNVLSADAAVAVIGASSLTPIVTGWSEPNHRRTSQAGTERLEDGSTITDHVVPMPARLSMRGHVSDISHPRGAAAPHGAWTTLKRLHKEKALLSIVTEWDIYHEMFIRNLDTTQMHRGMEFTIELQEIVRVGVETFTPKGRTKTADGRGPGLSTAERTMYGKIVNGRFYRLVSEGGQSEFVLQPGTVVNTKPDGTGRWQIVTSDEAAALREKREFGLDFGDASTPVGAPPEHQTDFRHGGTDND